MIINRFQHSGRERYIDEKSWAQTNLLLEDGKRRVNFIVFGPDEMINIFLCAFAGVYLKSALCIAYEQTLWQHSVCVYFRVCPSSGNSALGNSDARVTRFRSVSYLVTSCTMFHVDASNLKETKGMPGWKNRAFSFSLLGHLFILCRSCHPSQRPLQVTKRAMIRKLFCTAIISSELKLCCKVIVCYINIGIRLLRC